MEEPKRTPYNTDAEFPTKGNQRNTTYIVEAEKAAPNNDAAKPLDFGFPNEKTSPHRENDAERSTDSGGGKENNIN